MAASVSAINYTNRINLDWITSAPSQPPSNMAHILCIFSRHAFDWHTVSAERVSVHTLKHIWCLMLRLVYASNGQFRHHRRIKKTWKQTTAGQYLKFYLGLGFSSPRGRPHSCEVYYWYLFCGPFWYCAWQVFTPHEWPYIFKANEWAEKSPGEQSKTNLLTHKNIYMRMNNETV